MALCWQDYMIIGKQVKVGGGMLPLRAGQSEQWIIDRVTYHDSRVAARLLPSPNGPDRVYSTLKETNQRSLELPKGSSERASYNLSTWDLRRLHI